MKTVLALAAGASALVAPAAPKAQRTVVKALDTELGVLPPLPGWPRHPLAPY